jgi:hypothetical protein
MLSNREEMHADYWKDFIRYMGHQHPQYEFGKVSKESYQVVPPTSLKGQAKIAVGLNRRPEESIRVDVTLTSKNSKVAEEWYLALEADRTHIEAEVGISDGIWEWEERPGKPESHIIFRKDISLDGPRLAQYKWLAEAAHGFHEAFDKRILTLSSES